MRNRGAHYRSEAESFSGTDYYPPARRYGVANSANCFTERIRLTARPETLATLRRRLAS